MQQHVPASTDTFVRSFAKGLAVIRSFCKDAPEQTLSEVAGRTGLTRAGARRILLTLEALGYVHADGRKFRLSPRILDLGLAFVDSHPAWHSAQPHMQRLASEHSIGSGLTVLDGDSILFLTRTITAMDPLTSLALGGRYPAAQTASGQALLAALDLFELDLLLTSVRFEERTAYSIKSRAELEVRLEQVRRDGYALSDQEMALGVIAVAKVLRDSTGRVVAALSIPVDAGRYQPSTMRETMVPLLFNAVERIEADIRAQQANS
ncbi:MAG: helix-turn-helix domain-containing protein [Hyphomicrobiaceae bacterium]|nr:helix-turn-helix domain-containing protein [Hyphomicrobiaceae bacterium]